MTQPDSLDAAWAEAEAALPEGCREATGRPAMIGHPGPYLNDDGDIWVPRTVPWKEARGVALRAVQEFGDMIRYIGKEDVPLFGFTRDCFCEDWCVLADDSFDDYDPATANACRVPAWHFRQGEPGG